MNANTKIQVEFGEPAMELHIPVRPVLATASHLPGGAWVDSHAEPGNISNDATFNHRSLETEQLIARIREALRKQGA
jgi:hypothetical protein